MSSFMYYYQALYRKALKDNSIPDAEFIIENYPARDARDHVMNGRKWSDEEMQQFYELISSAGKYWRKNQIWLKMENRTCS